MRARKVPVITSLFLVYALTGNTLCGEMRTYRENAGDKEYINRYHIENQASGFFISTVSQCNQQVVLKKRIWLFCLILCNGMSLTWR